MEYIYSYLTIYLRTNIKLKLKYIQILSLLISIKTI